MSESVKPAITVRVEVWKDGLVLTKMENAYDTLFDALSPFSIKDITTFLSNKRAMLASKTPVEMDREYLTIKERLTAFLRWDERAPQGWFTSSEVRRRYEAAFGESVRLSTISTYLASLHVEGVLERKGSRAKRDYRTLMPSTSEPAPAAGYSVNEAMSHPPGVQKSASEI